MIYSTENILIQEVHLVLEDGKLVVKMSPAESQHALLAQQSQPTSGLTLDGKGQLGWGAPNSPSVLPTPSWTDHPSYTVSLPCQAVQSTKTLLWQTLQSGKEFAQQKMSRCWWHVGGESPWPAQQCPLARKEDRGLPWPLLCRDNKLQQITLEVRGTSQKSFSQTRSPFPQTNTAAVLTLCQWAQQKISSYCTLTLVLSRTLIYTPHPNPHTPPISQPFVFHRKQVDKPHLSIS